MKRSLWARLAGVGAVLVLAALYLAPSVTTNLPDWWKAVFPSDPIRLGLDLQGGMHLVLEVETEKAIEFSVERMVEDLKGDLAAAKIPVSGIVRDGTRRIKVTPIDPGQTQPVLELVKKDYPTLERGADSDGKLVFEVAKKEADRMREFATEQSLETVRNRVDQLGLSEPIIQRSGEDAILIQLPGETDPERAKGIIGKTAVLEFKLVPTSREASSVLDGEDPCRLAEAERKTLLAKANDRAGTAFQVLCGRESDGLSGRTVSRAYLLERKTLMTGEAISDAKPRPDHNVPGNYLVELEFNGRGASQFEQITWDPLESTCRHASLSIL